MNQDAWAQIIAAIVGALITGCIGIIAYVWKGRRGNHVVVRRISETPQISLSPDISKRLEIRYNGQQIKNLVLNSLTITNEGRVTIDPAEITVKLEPVADEIQFFEVEHNDPLNRTTVVLGEKEFTVKRSFLNPHKAYKEEKLKLAIFSNVNLNISTEGGGKDWYSKFQDETIVTAQKILPLLIIAILGLLVTISGFIFPEWGQTTFALVLEITVVALAIPFLFVVVVKYLFPELINYIR